MSFVHFYYDPVTEFRRGLFEDAFAARACPRFRASSTEAASRHGDVYRPKLNLHASEDSDTVTATFELAGLTSNDVVIDVHHNRLTVSGESPRSDAQGQEGRNHVVRECRSGKFSRTLQLPFGTRPEDVKAKMENGVLTITFPKTSPEQEAQRIIVQ